MNIIKTCLFFTLFITISCMEDRVKNAYAEKEIMLKSALAEKGFSAYFPTYIRVFKAEKTMEIWGLKDTAYQLFKTYPICNMSGTLGRKYKQGDKQVPEGFYHIERFNPKSSFHLSLGINYPNQADMFFAKKDNTGGDIFIHSDCVSIGCMAMTDDVIKEIYILATEANKMGQRNIPVHIFPFKMEEQNMTKYNAEFPQWQPFWQTLKGQYDYFEKEKQLLTVNISQIGEYIYL
jgi:murein L,D-transpeptidase YafK